MFDDKGGKGGLGKKDFCDNGDTQNLHDIIKGQILRGLKALTCN